MDSAGRAQQTTVGIARRGAETVVDQVQNLHVVRLDNVPHSGHARLRVFRLRKNQLDPDRLRRFSAAVFAHFSSDYTF